MTVNQSQKEKKKRNKSFLVTWLTRIIGFFSLLFEKSWIGRAIMNSGETFNNSLIRRWAVSKKQSIRKKSSLMSKLASVLDNGFLARCGRAIVHNMATMSVGVYGMFFAAFGVCTVLTHFVAIYVIPNARYDGQVDLIVGLTTAICSIPFLSSGKSVIQLFAGGKAASKISRGFLLIPNEKLWNGEKRGGVAYMFISAFLGIGCGVLSYFINPINVIVAFAVLIATILIFTSPEIGIILSCVLMPFLQYMDRVDAVMFILIVLTAISYVLKLIRGRRTFHMSSMGVMVVLFGVAMMIAGAFSPGGESAMKNSIYNVVIIFGAFFLGGNLTKDNKVRGLCVKILTGSLVIIAFLQFWNLYYINLSESVEQTLKSDYRSIIGNTGFGVASNLKIPGLWAAMISPLLIAQCFKKKRIYSVVALLLGFVPVVLSIAYFGTLEIMIALLIGVCIYLFLHSSKSVANIIIISLCLALVFMLVPIVAGQLGFNDLPNFAEVIDGIFPDSNELSSYRSHIEADTWQMLRDGNLLGIGSGSEAYKNAIAPYATPVSKNADMPGTAYMQILCEAGVLGLFIFAVFSVLLLKNGMKYVIKPNSRDSKILLLGLISGYMTALILGSVSCIFEDLQMRYLFWLCAGLISSQIYSDNAEGRRAESAMINTANEVDVIERI